MPIGLGVCHEPCWVRLMPPIDAAAFGFNAVVRRATELSVHKLITRCRMRLNFCPNCLQRKMFQTGAFWKCSVCAYAVTEMALRADVEREPERRLGDAITSAYKLVTESA